MDHKYINGSGSLETLAHWHIKNIIALTLFSVYTVVTPALSHRSGFYVVGGHCVVDSLLPEFDTAEASREGNRR